ncbi:hypothetical protein [Helicobacter cinaedi]|uniref:Uncharacterized protein n=1 Tax=Helicobacter cinaedi TaxID=213 RepID=A0A377JVF4_9HELI|nr:hypothetical protein [Helicobacter cinaedi]STP13339.1 Uncharacterised protein [Helicobacter cinaedi]STP13375.1 Uncharacterised protein [Helicobacter cinaedi]STP13732.1 Uncharacterised protein [Helicobacter cinaedi]STP13741.1 Uncharacterised protein [Helicobacter cinaedi]
MNLYRHKYYGGIYRMLSRKGGITLCRFFDSKREHFCKDWEEFQINFAKIPPREAKQIIASKYIHKKSGNVYRVRNCAICKDRDVEVVIYTDNKGKCYTREKSEFLEKFANEPKG